MKDVGNNVLEEEVASNSKDDQTVLEKYYFEMEREKRKNEFKESLVAKKDDLTLFKKELFQAAVGDEQIVQVILSTIFDRVNVQADLTELLVLTEAEVGEYKHGVRYDLLARDPEGNLIDLEVQDEKQDDLVQRSTYYLARLVVSQLDKGVAYENLKSSCVIFLAKQDSMNLGMPIYYLRLQSPDDASIFIDTLHLILVNGSYPYDGSQLSNLLHDFDESEPDKMKIPELKERVRYLKSPKGEKTMNAAFEASSIAYVEEHLDEIREEAEKLMKKQAEQLAKEQAEQLAKKNEENLLLSVAMNMLKKTSLSLEEIAECSNLPVEKVKILKESMINS